MEFLPCYSWSLSLRAGVRSIHRPKGDFYRMGGLMRVLIFAFLFFISFFSPAQASVDCAKFINRVIGENAASSPQKIDALDDLLTAFTQGLEPDLSNADQRMAFRMYRKLRFGDPKTSLREGSSQRIAKTLGQYPELREQQRFRNYKIKTQQAQLSRARRACAIFKHSV